MKATVKRIASYLHVRKIDQIACSIGFVIVAGVLLSGGYGAVAMMLALVGGVILGQWLAARDLEVFQGKLQALRIINAHLIRDNTTLTKDLRAAQRLVSAPKDYPEVPNHGSK